MLYKIVPRLRDALFLRQAQDKFLALLITAVLLATACGGPATPASYEAGYESSPEPAAPPSASISTLSPLELAEPALGRTGGPWSKEPAPSLSRGQRLRFERISLEQGLSQSTVLCMLQDSQGFMWFGTEGGLNRYDGYTFTAYKHDPEDPNGLGGNWIQAMLEDDSGTLWIGTSEGGLDRYDRELDQFIHYRNDPKDSSSLSDDEITTIYQDQDGVLWIGTGGGGLDRLVPSASSPRLRLYTETAH